MGSAVAASGSATMNDDDLLFPVDDLERWKRRELPKDWLVNRQALLLARLRALAAECANASGRPVPIVVPATPRRK